MESSSKHTDVGPNSSESTDAPTKFPVAPGSDNIANTEVEAKVTETATHVARLIKYWVFNRQ